MLAAAPLAPSPGPKPPTLSNYDIRMSPGACIAEAAVTGSPGIDQLVSALHVLGVELEPPAGAVGIVLDLTGLHSVFAQEELVRVGREIACSFAHFRRLALVVPHHRITRISERAAQRSGMDMRVFGAMHAAQEWLGHGA